MTLTRRMFDALPDASTAQRLLGEILAHRQPLGPVVLDRPLMLYGAGSLGRMIWDYCSLLGIPVEAVIDRNAEALRSDPFWHGKPLCHPDDIPPERRRSVILALCVVTAPYCPLAEGLGRDGWASVVPVYDLVEGYRDRHPLSNGWFAPAFSAAEEQQIFHVLQAFADDQSRAHHLQVLAWRCLRQEWVFPGEIRPLDERFFIPEVLAALPEQIRFLDAGAHLGTVSQSVIARFGARCQQIWAVEPDPAHHPALRSVLAAWGGPSQVISTPLAERAEGRGYRCGLGYASQLSDQGEPCQTTTIDALEVSPTFVKLHLEGAEGAALRGAQRTLEQARPVIAATSYHAADGLGVLPAWLLEAYPDGALYTRVHSWCGTGAVLYALPQRR